MNSTNRYLIDSYLGILKYIPSLQQVRYPRLSLPTLPQRAMSESNSSSSSVNGSTPAPGGAASTLKKAFPNVDIEGHNLPPSPAPSTPRTGRRYALATELVFTEGNDQHRASSMPIYQVREKVFLLISISSFNHGFVRLLR